MNNFVNTFEEETEIDLQKDMYLSFLLDNRIFAFSIKEVDEIIEVQKATEIPEFPEYVKGVINTKGRVIPVIDLRLRFKIPEAEYNERTCIIVLDIQGTNVGFIVDTVLSVLEISDDKIAPAPALTPENVSKYITGVAKIQDKLVIMLDSSKVIEQKTMDKIKEV